MLDNRSPIGDDSWIKIVQFLPDRAINIYCAITHKKTVSNTTIFIISTLTYILLIVILMWIFIFT